MSTATIALIGFFILGFYVHRIGKAVEDSQDQINEIKNPREHRIE